MGTPWQYMEMLGVAGKPALGAVTTQFWEGPARAVVFSMGWGPPASVLPYRGPSSSPTCPRRLAWPQRAPCPSLAGFCSRPPTWAPGQAPRQGPVQGNNATVFLMVEGRHKDEERHAQKKGRMRKGNDSEKTSDKSTLRIIILSKWEITTWFKIPLSLQDLQLQ